MSFGRILLWGLGLMLVAFGFAYLMFPVSMAALTGVSVSTPAAITDIRATYGGLQLGVGAFLLWSALAPDRIPSGLLALGLSAGGVASCRLVGLVVDGGSGPGIGPVHISAFVFEVATMFSALIGFFRTRSGQSPSAAKPSVA